MYGRHVAVLCCSVATVSRCLYGFRALKREALFSLQRGVTPELSAYQLLGES